MPKIRENISSATIAKSYQVRYSRKRSIIWWEFGWCAGSIRRTVQEHTEKGTRKFRTVGRNKFRIPCRTGTLTARCGPFPEFWPPFIDYVIITDSIMTMTASSDDLYYQYFWLRFFLGIIRHKRQTIFYSNRIFVASDNCYYELINRIYCFPDKNIKHNYGL